MLVPSRVKHRKVMRGRMKGRSLRGSSVHFGEFGLKALEPAWVTANQIESARIAINRVLKKAGKVWIRIFPDKPFTKKPAETRMGSGKGSPEGFVAVVRPGRIIFEVSAPSAETARTALTRAVHKLPMKCRIVERSLV
ncbi:MAG: 50S ribosomal protein L16 [Planctomycetales bacterium 4484_113]|nr:MAG: 50S ribosomal protein L16 [Planctomycetales bacterium 4484_113]